jgi:hypothetical protein
MVLRISMSIFPVTLKIQNGLLFMDHDTVDMPPLAVAAWPAASGCGGRRHVTPGTRTATT